MLVHWYSHFLSPNIQNKCFSERSCLDTWLTQFRLFCWFIRSIDFPSYNRNNLLTNTHRNGKRSELVDNAPLSSRFYECLFIGYTVDNQKIWHLMRQLREADTE